MFSVMALLAVVEGDRRLPEAGNHPGVQDAAGDETPSVVAALTAAAAVAAGADVRSGATAGLPGVAVVTCAVLSGSASPPIRGRFAEQPAATSVSKSPEHRRGQRRCSEVLFKQSIPNAISKSKRLNSDFTAPLARKPVNIYCGIGPPVAKIFQPQISHQ